MTDVKAMSPEPCPVAGLRHIRSFVSTDYQIALMELIGLEGWFDDSNQVMLFGRESWPEWLQDLAAQLPVSLFPAEVRHEWLSHAPVPALPSVQ